MVVRRGRSSWRAWLWKRSSLDKDQGWDWIRGRKKGMPARAAGCVSTLSLFHLQKKERTGETMETRHSSCVSKETQAGSWLCPWQHLETLESLKTLHITSPNTQPSCSPETGTNTP